jgi:hypothetical protein
MVGSDSVATGTSALYHATASFNVAHGTSALYNTTTGGWNTAVGDRAGLNATTGSYNVYIGAGTHGTGADANTMRLGLPYDGAIGAGQNRTFIAGIHGTVLTGPAVQVFVDANGQLGTLTAPPITGTIGAPVSNAPAPDPALQRQVEAQAARIAALEARLRHLEGLLKAAEGGR